jgi:uncharacterized protein (TIGR03435 family)
MAEFASFLSLIVLREPVEDRTGLEGPFVIDITHAPALMPLSTSEAAGLPSLMTALREQLGLALERIETTREALIIDRVGPFVEN